MLLAKMEAAVFFIATCFRGFRGFKTVWMDLRALCFDVDYYEEMGNLRAVLWRVTGQFKNEKGVWSHYCILIAGVTGSGVQVFKWTQTLIKRLEMADRTDGWSFLKNDDKIRALATDYANNIYSKLEDIQETTNRIDEKCNIR